MKEELLQQLIQSHPELLGPLGDGLQFVPIGFEVPTEGGRRLDLLFLDSLGVLTLIETKLRANDESRREVIGQVLEYALALDGWTQEVVRQVAQTFLVSQKAPEDLRGLSFEEALALRLGWDSGDESERAGNVALLLTRLDANLQKGVLRIVCGVDERIEGLERLVEYFSRHSDLQVVLLQVNSFPVDDGLHVFVPTLHGDVHGGPGRPPAPVLRFTIPTLIEAFDEGVPRDVVSALVKSAAEAGASFEPGPSGTSIRMKTSRWLQPVTVAWIFAPGKQGWMKTNDLSFGHQFADNPNFPAALVEPLEAYYRQFAGGVGSDASSKGVHAWRLSPQEAVAELPAIRERLTAILRELAAT